MPRNSFRWPPTHPTLSNVLKAHGFVESNGPGDVKQAEADDFALEPGQWQWNGTAWIAFSPPPQPPSELAQALDALLAIPTPTIPQIVAALRVWRRHVS